MKPKGRKRTVGLDEVGRGSLAGPVVACAVAAQRRIILMGMKDSKKLSAKKREEFYKILTCHPAIEWGLGRVSEKVIDKINILEATKLAMKRSLQNLEEKHRYHNSCGRRKCGIVNFLILDGKIRLDLPIPQRSIVKADEKIFSCMAASIIAKITRDRIMQRYHQKYPQYGFDKHKGYFTKLHGRMLRKYGPCPIHRKSFYPIKKTDI